MTTLTAPPQETPRSAWPRTAGDALFWAGLAAAGLLTAGATLFALSGADQGNGGPAGPIVYTLLFCSLAISAGLGLALARRVARGSGGDVVWRPAAPGGPEGAVFAVVWPRFSG